MCTLTKHDSRTVHAGLKRLAQLFLRDLNGFEVPELPGVTDVFTVPDNIPIWTADGPVLGVWPFLPKYIKTIDQARKEGQGAKSANVRVAEAYEKPTWRESILLRRCVVPLSAYVEYQYRGSIGVPYRIHRPDEECLFVGGIWADWYDGRKTFAIGTMDPNALNAWIHNRKPRQPVILENDDEVKQWMKPGGLDGIESLLIPRDDDFLTAEESEGKQGKRPANPPPAPAFNPPTQGMLF